MTKVDTTELLAAIKADNLALVGDETPSFAYAYIVGMLESHINMGSSIETIQAHVEGMAKTYRKATAKRLAEKEA